VLHRTSGVYCGSSTSYCALLVQIPNVSFWDLHRYLSSRGDISGIAVASLGVALREL